MTFLRLKNDRLRISLTKTETEQLFGSADNIDQNDPSAKLVLKMLFKRAVQENVFKPGCNSVFIEIVKNLCGGYDIYFVKSRLKLCEEAPKQQLILEFKSCNDAICAARVLRLSRLRLNSSRFYRLYDRYRMIVCVDQGINSLPGAVEFTDCILSSAAEIAKTKEHGTELLKENAVEVLAEL